ncbi:MAG TPA: site-specific integrase, partial [Thermoanaerobaculia bacterium]
MLTLSRAIDGFEAYLADERRFSPATVRAYRSDLDRFASFWEEEFAHKEAGKTPLKAIDTLA